MQDTISARITGDADRTPSPDLVKQIAAESRSLRAGYRMRTEPQSHHHPESGGGRVAVREVRGVRETSLPRYSGMTLRR